jgi:hypothetical protein
VTTPEPEPGDTGLDTDLVEAIVVVVPERAALGAVADRLVEVLAWGSVRLLDLLVCRRDAETDALVVLEAPEVPELSAFVERVEAGTRLGATLTVRDAEVATLALTPGSLALVVLVEDRWARPIAEAVRSGGGEVLGGARVPGSRVRAALATRPVEPVEPVEPVADEGGTVEPRP